MSDHARTLHGLEKSVAVVIGAGGMASVVAGRLGQRHHLVIADIDAERLNSRVEWLLEAGCSADAVVCDVTDAKSVAALAEKVKTLGGFEKLAHVTGLSPGMAGWRDIMAVNLVGPKLVTDALAPFVKPGISALLVASLAAHMQEPPESLLSLIADPLRPDLLDRLDEAAPGGMSAGLAYILSKVGLIRLARSLSVSWGAKGGRVVSLSPGLIASPQGLAEFENSPNKVEYLRLCPLQRQGGLQEIADAVEFLLSERASYITGTDLLVDGGLSARGIN